MFSILLFPLVLDRSEDQVVVVRKAQEGEHQLPDEVQDRADNSQESERDDNLGDQFAPGELLCLPADVELEVEAVVGPRPPGVARVGDDLLGLVACLGKSVHTNCKFCGQLLPVWPAYKTSQVANLREVKMKLDIY